MYENLLFSALLLKNKNVKFWRSKSGAEVDFVLEGKDIIPIEVKTSLSGEKVGKSLYSFIEKYNPTHAYITSLTFEAKKKKDKCSIQFLPFVKFLVKEV